MVSHHVLSFGHVLEALISTLRSLFIYSTRVYWVLTHVPNTVLGSEDTVVSKTDKNPYYQGAYVLVEADRQK